MIKTGVIVLGLLASFGASALPITGQIDDVCSDASEQAIQSGVVSQEVQNAYNAYKDDKKPNPNVEDSAKKNDDKCYGNVKEQFEKLYPKVKID